MAYETDLQTLIDEVHHGLVNRRAVLKRAAALGLSAPVIAGLLAACGSDDDDDDDGAATEPTATPEPSGGDEDEEPTATEAAGSEKEEPTATEVEGDEESTEEMADEATPTEAAAEPTADTSSLPFGGHANVTYAGAGQPATLDTQVTSAGLARFTTDPINEWLVRYDQDNEIIPSLASNMEVVDEVTLRFTLREGVMFHNGRTLTADDVKQNIERIQDPASASPFASPLEPVESVEVEDDLNVVFHLNRPYPALTATLTRIPILPLEAVDQMATDPVGAGPFKFVDWRQDSYIDYERFEDYWDSEQPRLDSIRWSFLPDYASGKASFQAGEQDMLFYLSLVDVEVFEAMEGQGIHARTWETLGFTYLAMNHEREPYNDVRVRQAIQYAIDPDAFNSIAYAGFSKPHRIPIASGTPFYFDDFEYGRDLDRARSLMEEAGLADGFEDEVLIPNTSFEAPYGEIIQSNLADIGIDLSILIMEPGPFVERTLQNKDYNICMLGDSPLPDPAFLLDRYLKSDGGANLFNYNSPEMDELLTNAGSTYDIDERIAFYKQAMELMVEEAVWQIVLQRAKADAWSDPLLYDAFWSPTGNRYHWGQLAVEE